MTAKGVSMMADGDENFIVNVEVAVSPIFFGWIFQFGDMVEVLSPQNLVDELKERSQKLLERYQ